MTNLGRLIAVITAALLVICAAVLLFFRSPYSSEGLYRVSTAVGLEAATPERHVVPEDFSGWAVVHYAVEGAPPLREDDGAVIVEYPADGRLETSTPAPDDEGLLHRGYYRQTAAGLVPLSRAGDVWGEFSHREFRDDHFEVARRLSRGEQPEVASRSSGFFVGTMTEFLATPPPASHREPEGAGE